MTYQPMVEAGPPRSAIHPPQQHSVHQTQSAHPPQPVVGQGGGLQPQRSFSSSEEERSTPECASDEPDESEKGESMLDTCQFFLLYHQRTSSRTRPRISISHLFGSLNSRNRVDMCLVNDFSFDIDMMFLSE